MIQNFDTLLIDVMSAKNRSQLEYAKDVADTFLQNHLDAADITAVDYHAKQAKINDAYHKQLLEFSNLNPMQVFNRMLHQKALGAKIQIQSEFVKHAPVPKLICAIGGLPSAKKWLSDLSDGVHYHVINGEIMTLPKRQSTTLTKRELANAIAVAEG